MSRAARFPFAANKLQALSLDNGLTGVLDIGTAKVSCFIVRNGLGSVDGPEMEVIGVGHQAASGVGEGGIVEPAADSAIRAAIDKAERMAGERLEQCHLAIPAQHLACRRLRVSLDLDGGPVMQEDINACLKEGARLAAGEGLVPLHLWPGTFSVDGVSGVRDPRGLDCTQLSVDLVALSASKTAVRAARASLERCRIKPASLIAAPHAAGLAVLHEEERELGVLSLDIGARTTGYALYRAGSLVFAGAVPVGSDHVTRDLALGLAISREAAERLKVVHGTAWCMPGDDTHLVDLPADHGDRRDDPRAAISEIADIIGPRLSEIFSLTRKNASAAGIDLSAYRRAVVTGGGSQMRGLAELMESVLDLNVRIGRPVHLHGAPGMAGGNGFAVCAGMVDYLASEDRAMIARVPVMSGHLAGQQADMPQVEAPIAASPIGRAAHWLRTHF